MKTEKVWKVMLSIVVEPCIAVSRAMTRPRAVVKPPPPKPRFDEAGA